MATGFASEAPTSSEACSPPEGIAFDEEGRVLMEEFQWDGRPESAGAPGNARVTGDSGAADTADATDYPTAPPPDFDWEAELAEHRCTIARPAPRRAPTAKRNATPRFPFVPRRAPVRTFAIWQRVSPGLDDRFLPKGATVPGADYHGSSEPPTPSPSRKNRRHPVAHPNASRRRHHGR